MGVFRPSEGDDTASEQTKKLDKGGITDNGSETKNSKDDNIHD